MDLYIILPCECVGFRYGRGASGCGLHREQRCGSGFGSAGQLLWSPRTHTVPDYPAAQRQRFENFLSDFLKYTQCSHLLSNLKTNSILQNILCQQMMCNIAPMAEFKPKSTKMYTLNSNFQTLFVFIFSVFLFTTTCPDSTNPKKSFLLQTVSGIMIHCGTMSQHKKIQYIFFNTYGA